MSTYGEEIVTLLSADATLVNILTGGIYNYPETGRKGLTRLLTPVAYSDVTGLLKPVCVVLELDEMATYEIVGRNMSGVTPVILWIYDKATTDVGYSVVDAAYQRIFSLLHLAQITGACQVLWKQTVKNKREADLKEAGYYRAMFNVYGYRTA